MTPLTRFVLLGATPVALAVAVEILSSSPLAAAKAQDVFVTNAAVPVSGTIEAIQSGPWTVTNPMDAQSLPVPLTVRDDDKSVNKMWQGGGLAQFQDGDAQIHVTVFTTPSDASLVLDSININGSLPAGQRAALTVYTGAQLSFAPVFVGSLNGNDRLVVDQRMNYFVNQNWVLKVWVDRLNATTGSGFVSFMLGGHYVAH